MMLTPETFWDYSVNLYTKPGVAQACIALQDSEGININLLLLYCWCIEHQYTPTPEVRRLLADTISQTNGAIEQHRSLRRASKGKPGYESLKQQELDMEAAQQQVLVNTLLHCADFRLQQSDIVEPVCHLATYMELEKTPHIISLLRVLL